ncbi:anhydro-N-acetylmuramic acid kinase AnmK [Granulicatella adiacens ATCC 49175]|uniref:Anhydro-N-acetylmuramic acid kinase n=1 Tax=Granulicatella adiacens ATCC 49175 TaxID=638301 RepID=C8NHI7_9LACT|nr:anhydro-N-acetylmuramic acid kinase AnmK [Granulicatella adiacens]EEW37164.1 anhydro-N-acetylmuramic acid kinase [Granulicatella adiacens ATCC 49175]UAK94438.1 anhydro-N-acetylmuramic acid kinase [Granulicatella adiacens]UWP38320.1 anhydro-N-acetylmuramic acid kinase AnmK [Granulicatella adiacens ATCC 49175]
MLAVGLMSGTSLDGVDTVLCEISGQDESTKVKQLYFKTYDIPESLRTKIRKCCSRELIPVDLICSVNFELGYLFADSVKSLCKDANVKLEDLSFIASHGQTIFHIPKPYDDYVPSTLQIGEAAIIANECKTKVISNFRVMDMAVGGEGAPLVPYSETLLYSEENQAVALQNIGGIGNVTVLPKKGDTKKVIAFDTGPGNMMIDEAVRTFYGKKYDTDGYYARQGNLISSLAAELKEHPYFNLEIPKTTGREMFGEHFTKSILEKYHSCEPNDLIHTFTWFTAYSIAYHYKKYLISEYGLKKCIIGGGGAYNSYLLELIRNEIPEVTVMTQEEHGFSSEAKEALAFVILGNQTYHRSPSNVPSATGAKKSVILGQITYPTL